MKKWHITITENETGNTLVDLNTSVIVAGIDEDAGTRMVHLSNDTAMNHAAALCGVQETVNEAKQENPLLALLIDAYFKRDETDETDETPADSND